MNWKVVADRLISWLGFSIGLMVLPIALSIIMYVILKAQVHFEMYIKEMLLIIVTLAATSMNDVYALTKKGIHDWRTTSLLVSLVLVALFSISIYVIVNMCSLLSLEYNTQIVNHIIILFGFFSFIISGGCQAFLANIEGDKT